MTTFQHAWIWMQAGEDKLRIIRSYGPPGFDDEQPHGTEARISLDEWAQTLNTLGSKGWAVINISTIREPDRLLWLLRRDLP